MVEVADAVRQIISRSKRLEPVMVSRGDALGKILAVDVRASEDQPPFPASTVDGYAMRSEDGSAARVLRGDVRAGFSGNPIGHGEAVRIMTGAPVPEGADTVVMFEWAEQTGNEVTPEKAPGNGDNIREVGSDLSAGSVVIPAGARIGPTEIGLLASLGVREVQVYRPPVVAIVSTGDELVPADEVPSGPAIRDSNGPALAAALLEFGAEPKFMGIARDTEEEQFGLISRALSEADVVLTSGGVSVGSHDLIKPIFSRLGTIHFGRINFKPGKPLTFATAGAKLLFGLPGNPVSSLVCLSIFIRPALRLLAGETDTGPVLANAVAGEPLRRSLDRPDFQRVIACWVDGQLVVRSTGAQGSSRLLSLAGSNALAIVPAGSGSIPAGGPVDIVLVGPVPGDRRLAD
jgi:molybdopterin molybdotransferase